MTYPNVIRYNSRQDESCFDALCNLPALGLDDEDFAFSHAIFYAGNALGASVHGVIAALQKATLEQRRSLVDSARRAAGLPSREDVEAHQRFLAVNRALKPRPLPTCAAPACDAPPLDANGQPDPNHVAVRRWWCVAHADLAGPGDFAPLSTGVMANMQAAPNPEEVEHERRRDAEAADRIRERAEERALRAREDREVSRLRAEQESRELFGGPA